MSCLKLVTQPQRRSPYSRPGVERAEWFIQQQHAGSWQGARLTLTRCRWATRQTATDSVFHSVQVEPDQEFRTLAANLRVRQTPGRRLHAQANAMFSTPSCDGTGRRLKDESDARSPTAALAGILAVEKHPARSSANSSPAIIRKSVVFPDPVVPTAPQARRFGH